MPTLAIHYGRRPPPQFQSSSLRKLILFFLKCVIMVFVFSIFLFFLGFAAIVLLHFLFMSNTLHRRCSRFLQSTNTAAQSAVSPVSSAFSLPYIQTLLPTEAYSNTVFPRTADCAICLDSFREGDLCRNLPVCNHLFHAKCVDKWIGRKPNCPICRARVDLAYEFPGGSVSVDDRWKRLWGFGFEGSISYY